MNWIDVVVIVATVALAFVAYKHGIISVAFTVLGFVVGIALASRFHGFLGDSDVGQVLAFTIVLVGVLIIANIVGAKVKTGIDATRLGWVDKSGAAAVGALVALLICASLLAVVAKTATFGAGDIPGSETEVARAVENSQAWATENIRESFFAEILLGNTPVIRWLLPGDFDFLKHFFG